MPSIGRGTRAGCGEANRKDIGMDQVDIQSVAGSDGTVRVKSDCGKVYSLSEIYSFEMDDAVLSATKRR